MFKVLSVDPSINSLGWAVLNHVANLIDGGVLELSGSEKKLPVSSRLNIVVGHLKDIIRSYELGRGDYLVCESQPHIVNARNALILERVRGSLEGVALCYGLEVLGRVNPRSLHLGLLKHSKQCSRKIVKQEIRNFIERHFNGFYKKTVSDAGKFCQDVYDAIAIGYYFVIALKAAKTKEDCRVYLSDY